MTDVTSSLTRTVARQYDLFQTSLELLQKDRKFLNYGYTVSGKEAYEARDGSAPNRRTVPRGRGISAPDPCAASMSTAGLAPR